LNHTNQRLASPSKRAFISMLFVFLNGCTLMLDGQKESLQQIDFGVIENVAIATPSMSSQYDLIGGYGGLTNVVSLASMDPEIATHLQLDTRRYKIRDENGKIVTYLTDKSFFVEGDCVAIEKNVTLNLRLVDDSICQGAAPNKSVKTEIEQAAARCAMDKRQLIIAQGEAQIRAANNRIHRDCQYKN
jgi:hypothetical protein